MELRYYQEEAKNAILEYFKTHPGKNPCVVLPTGAGKTPLLASICKGAVAKGNRVLVVSHVKELLEQSRNTLAKMCPEVSVGLYSAGLGRKDTWQKIIVAGVQSVYRKYADLGRIDIVIVDEAHLIPPDGDGMYQSLLRGLKKINNKVKLIGLTATPYRMKTGKLCGPKNFLNDVCYEINIKELIDRGYLSRLETRMVDEGEFDTAGLHIRMGEYVASEVDDLVNRKDKIESACREIISKMVKFKRKKALIFASNVNHAKAIKIIIEGLSNEKCGIILGDTDKKEREKTLFDFKEGRLRYLVNVDVLTTGFDDPTVDVVVLLRPTASPGLYYQMVGRGLRVSDGKAYCLILDFGQNILRHGPVDLIEIEEKKKKKKGVAPFKYCPKCKLGCHASARVCSDCGFVFPEPEGDKSVTFISSRRNIISKESIDEVHQIFSVRYYEEYARQTGYPYIQVSYTDSSGKQIKDCLFIGGNSSNMTRFEEWWSAHSLYPCPMSNESFFQAVSNGNIANDLEITIRKEKGSKYHRIVDRKVGVLPVVDINKMHYIPCKTCYHYRWINCACYSRTKETDVYFDKRFIHPECGCCLLYERNPIYVSQKSCVDPRELKFSKKMEEALANKEDVLFFRGSETEAARESILVSKEYYSKGF